MKDDMFERACMARDVKDFMDGVLSKHDFCKCANQHLRGVTTIPTLWVVWCVATLITQTLLLLYISFVR